MYGDVTTVIGSYAAMVGNHLATCGRYPTAWRILTATVA
jgi:hypothetical protein